MKRRYILMLAGAMAVLPVARGTDRVVTTEAATGPGSLTAAISALNDGDRITFNISPGTPSVVHYIQTPFDGYPLITKNNITIDGYTQPGASPNTASIHSANNATLKIVLTSTNGNALSMYTACSTYAGIPYNNFGFGDGEQAILGFFRASNVWVKGFCFQAAPQTSTSQKANGDCKTICFAIDAPEVSSNACQNFHVSGCWWGIDPVSKQVAFMPDGVTVATPAIAIATYGTGTNGDVVGFPNIELWPGPGTIGVAAGSADPRAEFNVFITGYGFDSQGGPLRVAGNFWGILPDGVTLGDISTLNGAQQQGDAFVEFGVSHDVLVGTDGDGVNDTDEANIFGSYQNGGLDIDFYSSPQTNIVIAGNTFGVDIHGKSFNVGPLTRIVHQFNNDSTVRFGCDFNGTPASTPAVEGNVVADALLFAIDSNSNTNSHWISMRGNSLTNTMTPYATRPPIGDGQGDTGQAVYEQFIDDGGNTALLIPVIASANATALSGTCGLPLQNTNQFGIPYTNLFIDLYLADPEPANPPQGMTWLARYADNSTADANPAVGAFTFSTAGLGLHSGSKLTMTVTYTTDVRPVIQSVTRSGGQTTITIKNGGSGNYGVWKSATVTGTYTYAATAINGSVTFPDSNATSFYRVTAPTATGQTSPFSDVFNVP